MAGYGGRDYRDPGYESEDSADYQPAPEEDEEIVDEPATFEDIQKELENSGAMGEALQRLLKLFEKQRLETQRLLSKAEEKETSQDFVNQVLTGILSKNVDATLALLARASPVCVMQIVDFNGMSALHHAAKLGLVVIVDALLEINPAVADKITRADGRPAHWTALMVLADSWVGSDEQCDVLRSLLWATSQETFKVCTLSGNNVFHLAASHGNIYFVKRLCYGLCLVISSASPQ